MVEEDCSNLMRSDPYWLPHIQYRGTWRVPSGKVGVFNLTAARQLLPHVTSGLSLTSVQTAGAQWLVDAVHPFGTCRSCTAVLTHDPFEIRFGQFFLTIHPKRLMYHRPVRCIYPKFWRSLPRKRIGDYTKSHDRMISVTKTSLLFARPVFDHFWRWHLHHTPANILRFIFRQVLIRPSSKCGQLLNTLIHALRVVIINWMIWIIPPNRLNQFCPAFLCLAWDMMEWNTLCTKKSEPDAKIKEAFCLKCEC